MIEVAHAILEQNGEAMSFADIVNNIQQFLNKSDAEIRQKLPQFYTDLNADGGFISLGENVWGLRTWYPYDSVDEEVNHPEDAEEGKVPAIKRVNAFLDDEAEDDDIIDYNAQDAVDDDHEQDQGVPDLSKFGQADLSLDDDDEEIHGRPDLEDGLEGDLSEFTANDDEDLDS
ncbi:DNA-directed RNA polymerase subunit delta [Lactobacillus sp. DCY120]|uniref:Probable DNA-directed RNA polymerase subunit delta n=1 Tax=Bombilactobacillus apium TaxID=2675299 RepID=A0A850R673_9LACO|nr:DNA-directed RNA polymerase subunit delta [Bombilactobacillus apium]NVY96337.1 DNA-directed RNA polymerase subunit delta [Bombilactobacillus apium]